VTKRRLVLPFVMVVAATFTSVGRAQDRMPAIPADKMTDAQKKAVAEAMPNGGELPRYLAAMVHSPDVMPHVKALGDYAVRGNTVFSARQKEFMILIALKHWGYMGPWSGHFQSAVKEGVDERTGKAIEQGQKPTTMAADEQLLYDYCTQLLKPQVVDLAVYKGVVEKFGEKGVTDAIALMGYYSINAMTFNATLH